LPDLSQGGSLPIGETDFERIRSVGIGGSLQATLTAPLFGHGNHLSVGGSIDHATTDFSSAAELGVIDPQLRVTYSGLFIDTPEGTGFTATPVSLNATSRYEGVFLSDSFDVTEALTLTVSGRYSIAEIDLTDQIGSALSGNNRYTRLNPAAGFADKLTETLTFYFGYAEGNRVPTPGEIECSNPLAPCLLPSSLSSDPPNLKQVVSHSYEVGLRGVMDSQISWSAGLFRTDIHDDIYGVATSVSTGYFQNIGGTRRQGAELGLRYRGELWSLFADYSYVDATFRSPLLLNSPFNPDQDGDGNIQVLKGDRLPGIPRHRIKAGADYEVLPGWSVGGTVSWVSGSYYRGDEATLMAPLPGYAAVNLHSSCDLGHGITLTLRIDNALDARYANFGLLGDPTGVGAPGVLSTNVDHRLQSPSPPISVFTGVRAAF
jgi:iron complex outermembrane receptor protein